MKSATYKLLSLRAASRRKSNLAIFALLLMAAFVVPVFASAATSAGVTPGSFWYFFDTASEKIALFFTFNPENKAKKALEYADERLAEVDAIAGGKNPDAIKAAIADYEGNVALATEKSKEVKDKGQAESLFASIESSASKNQEVLSAVLIKVPEEAKAAITQAIEASKKGQEEAARQIADLKGEVEKLKQEVAELKQAKDVGQSSEVEKLKKEVEALKTKQAQQLKPVETKIVEKVVEKNVEVSRPMPVQPVAPAQPVTSVIPAVSPIPQAQILKTIEISSVIATPSLNSAIIEWQTDILTNSKIFLFGGSLSLKVYNSESGLSTRHIVNVSGLTSGTTYSYAIESIAGDQVAKKDGSFSTKPDEYTISVQPDKTSVPASGWSATNLKVSVLKNGQIQANQAVSMLTPDSVQNQTRPTNGISSTGANDWNTTFVYYPKTTGIHTLVFSWNGISKNIDIQATEYVEQKPVVKLSSAPTTLLAFDSSGITTITIGVSNLEENMKLEGIYSITYNIVSSDFTKSNFELTLASSNLLKGENGDITLKFNKFPSTVGKFKLEITDIKLIGQQSGHYRTVNGLPLVTSEISTGTYDANLVEWYAYNYNHTILGYSSLNQNENSLVIINRSQTKATVSAIEWEKQTTGNLQVQNILVFPALPYDVQNYNQRKDFLVKITYSGTPKTGDTISIKPTITLSTGQKLECAGGNGCWITWSQ